MSEEKLLENLKKNPFLLAPMAGITDSAFRLSMRELGCGIVISELVSANGLKYANEKTKMLMRFDEGERPVGLQIFGEEPEALTEAARYVEELGADFVDLNLGCPVKKIVKKGAGSAMLKDPPALGRLLRKMKNAIGIPLTIKIRTGWDFETRNAPEVVQVAYDSGVTWVAIHGRTRSQAYNGEADWDYIAKVKQLSPLPIIGNGDIKTPENAVERIAQTAVDGVMIGRGCLKNPWIFQQALQLWDQDLQEAQGLFDYCTFFEKLYTRTCKLYDEKFVLIQMRKFSTWCSAGFPGSAQFRRDMFTNKTMDGALKCIDDYYRHRIAKLQDDTSGEKFLMGGHG